MIMYMILFKRDLYDTYVKCNIKHEMEKGYTISIKTIDF